MLSVSFVVYVPKEAYGCTTTLEGLGDISRYNAVVFGNHKAIGGDIEGAIAVQGDMDASGYTIVGAAAGTSNIVGENGLMRDIRPCYCLENLRNQGKNLLSFKTE